MIRIQDIKGVLDSTENQYITGKFTTTRKCSFALARLDAQLPINKPIANVYNKEGALPNTAVCSASKGTVV